jgi:ubiquinol-cytochrome c reductase cytochrome c subunit
MKIIAAVFTGFVAAAALAYGGARLGSSAEDPAVTRGRALFTKVGCYECHGYAGQGGAAGPRIAARLPYGAFAAYVRHPAREMPPYTTKVLSDTA